MCRLYFHRFCVPALAVAAAGLAASASAQTSTVIIAPSAPPPPRVETVPRPPSASPQTMSWQAGHWAWNGGAWVWDEGHYVQAPQAQAVWEPGHWEQQATGGYVWIDGPSFRCLSARFTFSGVAASSDRAPERRQT